jgi:hypothetical protein
LATHTSGGFGLQKNNANAENTYFASTGPGVLVKVNSIMSFTQ